MTHHFYIWRYESVLESESVLSHSSSQKLILPFSKPSVQFMLFTIIGNMYIFHGEILKNHWLLELVEHFFIKSPCFWL